MRCEVPQLPENCPLTETYISEIWYQHFFCRTVSPPSRVALLGLPIMLTGGSLSKAFRSSAPGWAQGQRREALFPLGLASGLGQQRLEHLAASPIYGGGGGGPYAAGRKQSRQMARNPGDMNRPHHNICAPEVGCRSWQKPVTRAKSKFAFVFRVI